MKTKQQQRLKQALTPNPKELEMLDKILNGINHERKTNNVA